MRKDIFVFLLETQKYRIIKLFEGLPKFLRGFREGLPDFQHELMRVFHEGLS